MVHDPQTDVLLTVREVAIHLRVDATTVRRWIKGGALEAVILPRGGERHGYRIKQSTLETLFNASLPATSSSY